MLKTFQYHSSYWLRFVLFDWESNPWSLVFLFFLDPRDSPSEHSNSVFGFERRPLSKQKFFSKRIWNHFWLLGDSNAGPLDEKSYAVPPLLLSSWAILWIIGNCHWFKWAHHWIENVMPANDIDFRRGWSPSKSSWSWCWWLFVTRGSESKEPRHRL